MTTQTNRGWIGLKIDPLDVLFFRDGRPFGAAIRASGRLPNPQTLAGALRERIGRNRVARTACNGRRAGQERQDAEFRTHHRIAPKLNHGAALRRIFDQPRYTNIATHAASISWSPPDRRLEAPAYQESRNSPGRQWVLTGPKETRR